MPLTKDQTELLREFYAIPLRRVLLTKPERDTLWESFKETRSILTALPRLEDRCPALRAEVTRSLASGKNVQSAVFSECVYAQALADQFGLGVFINYNRDSHGLSAGVREILETNGLVPRYVYTNDARSRLLVQAGGHGGVDAALISVVDKSAFLIEFKEPGAKTSEADLPKYEEDGNLVTTTKFEEKYPQFVAMMREQLEKGLNFWERAGSNINDFSPESLVKAVTGNYGGEKFAHVICTEDAAGNLTMLPPDHVHMWADLQGEIRPAGRNRYRTWTPHRLIESIAAVGGKVDNGRARIPVWEMSTVKPRGGTGVSRYKISPLFFVYATDVTLDGTFVTFSVAHVWQLNPTIAAKMFFKGLDAKAVRDQYRGGERDGRNS